MRASNRRLYPWRTADDGEELFKQAPPGTMADAEVLFKIDDLSDLEIAVLLSLIAREHCIVDTEPELMDDLLSELRLV